MASGLPLSALLPDRLDSMAERVKANMCDNEQVGGMDLAWDFIGKEIHGALKAALDCDLIEILAKGWAQADTLADFGDAAKHPPGERSVVSIGEHEVSRELHPIISVTIGPCPSVDLKFTFAIAAHISGVRLSIVDRHIIGGDLGEAWASAQLSYGDVPLHSTKESRKVALPGDFSFDPPGVRIPRLSLAPAPAASGKV